MNGISQNTVTVGIDYGTLSGRAVVVRVADGTVLASASYDYPHAVMDTHLSAGDGQKLPPDWALQNPADYLAVLRHAVPTALENARRVHGIEPDDVIAVGTDFTACTMIPTGENGLPLCALEKYRNRPHAYAKLWKHHAAQPQADRINALARERGETWLARYGGLISSEWEFAKGLQLLEEDPELYAATVHWVEAADWIVWQLTGNYVRNACSAGYKGMRQDGEYPSEDFLTALNPNFSGFVKEKLAAKIGQLGECAGYLSDMAAALTGLPEGIPVSVGNVDAHVTAPAADACRPGQMVAIMGTSTCHVMNGEKLAAVPGMCGAVYGGITKGYWGYEAGQSGVGDIFGWFIDNCLPREYAQAAEEKGITPHSYLSTLAATQEVGQHGLIALDWHSGNRSVLVDHELSGLIVGQTLQTRPEDQYRALLEATAFGTRKIIETFRDSGIAVNELVVAGGLLKNPLLMQIYADVTNLPLSTIVSEQGPALGSAIHAAVAAGAYPDVVSAGAKMGARRKNAYLPIPENVARYNEMYAQYARLHDYFGDGEVMHRLKRLRREAFIKISGADR
ncbi:ribulokinase [Dermabacteraceae bacterium TAE3-ERU5]|nr:ribulokinase [Dermabacteraceae bacterium TAE3-ERU5]